MSDHATTVSCAQEGCTQTHPDHRWGAIRAHAAGWYQQKSGLSWCPDHRPSWAPRITSDAHDEPDAEAAVPPAVAKKHMDVVAGALGAAGHTIEDPVVLGILKRQAAGEITGDRARHLLLEHDAGAPELDR